ncbi:hypothetical protein ACGF5M_04465 [Gemmatimonadota bacterium]
MPSCRVITALSIALLCALLSGCLEGGATPVRQESAEMETVPQTDGVPVMIDGVFSEGEWDDALLVDASEAVKLYLKQEKGHVFIGVRCIRLTSPIVNLYIQPTGGEIYKLHTSAQIGEIVLGDSEEEDPPWVWGHSPDWYANEVRWDQSRVEQLISEGVPRGEAQARAIFPYDGFEFQIRASKFESSEWRIRVEVPSAFEVPFVFPPETEGHSTDGWLILSL